MLVADALEVLRRDVREGELVGGLQVRLGKAAVLSLLEAERLGLWPREEPAAGWWATVRM